MLLWFTSMLTVLPPSPADKNSNLVYVVEYDGKYVTKDNETFYKYTVLDGEDEVKIEADNQIQNITGSVYGVANYLTKSGDRYTDFQLVKQDKDVVVYGTGSSDIKQSAGTLVLGADKFVVASDAKITPGYHQGRCRSEQGR